MRLCIILNYNLYESKRYFSQRLGEALKRRGVEVQFLDLGQAPTERFVAPDFCCSFNRTVPNREGQFFWDEKKIPFLSLLVDPVFYDLNLIRSPLSYLTCVDQNDRELLESKGFKKVLFWPHAVERELAPAKDQEKPYDVVFLGSSYDPEGLKAAWSERYSPPIQALIEESADLTLSEAETPFWEAVQHTASRMKIDPMELDFRKICTLVDNYVRGIDRLELIRAVAKIPGIKVHLFGGSCWRDEIPIHGWGHYFGGSSQVVVHPAIPYSEALEVMKRSRLCLNSSPFFKKGSHERILAGLACGSLTVTTESQWVRSQFVEGEELLLYRPKQWADVTDKIQYFLKDEKARQAVVDKGRAKVMQAHTWDNRVDELLRFLD